MKKTEGIKHIKKKKTMKPKTKKVLTILCSVVLVCGLLSAYVATGAIRGGLLSFFAVPQKVLTGLVVTNGDDEKTKMTPAQYNYYYASAYNQLYSTLKSYEQYGLDAKTMGFDVDFKVSLDKQVKETKDDGTKVTWGDYMKEQTLDKIKSVTVFYNAAVKDNDNKEPEITTEEQKEIDDAIKSYQEAADKNGYTLDACIRSAIGKGVNEKLFRAEMKKGLIATAYQKTLETSVKETKRTVEEAQAYFDKNTVLLSAVDVQVFKAADKKAAEAMLASVKANNTDQGFADAASAASTTEYAKDAYKNTGKTVENNLMKKTAQGKYQLGDDGYTWLYATDRVAGDVAIYSDYVVRVIKPIYKSETPTVTVRHILIEPETAEDAAATAATKEQWAAAKAKADAVVAKWKEAGATEDAFSALTTDNSADTGSASTGGLIENAFPGQMVNEFNSWIFSSHKAGDMEIVRTDYGYHLIYFVSVNTTPYWQSVAVESIGNDEIAKKLDGAIEDYKVKTRWFSSKFFIDDKNLGS